LFACYPLSVIESQNLFVPAAGNDQPGWETSATAMTGDRLQHGRGRQDDAGQEQSARDQRDPDYLHAGHG
jgi:hypothetical protein